MNKDYMTPEAALRELARRSRQYRIGYPMTQRELSDKSGISLRSIQRFEKGEDIQVTNLIRILEALGLSEHMAQLIPDVTDRPSMHLPKYKPRQRARAGKSGEKPRAFQWGDEK